MSQLPPCSRGGTVRAPSPAALSRSAPCNAPMCAVLGAGGFASGGTRLGLVSISACSRRFQVSSSFLSGRQPIRPGWISPAKFTPGIWRDEVNMPWKSQMDFCACGKCSVRNPPPLLRLKKPLNPHRLSGLAPMSSRSTTSRSPGSAPSTPTGPDRKCTVDRSTSRTSSALSSFLIAPPVQS